MTAVNGNPGYSRAVRRPLCACLAASLAAIVFSTAASAEPQAVCVATGILAVQSTPAAAPQPVGPTLTGPARAGSSADATTDSATGLSIASAELGVAGCIDAEGAPGGTTLRAGAWSLLSGAVEGSALRADLVPASGDGSGWRLRTTADQLTVDGRPASVAPGVDAPLGEWGQISAQATVERAATGGVRWWRSAFQVRLIRPHDGFPAGTVFLVGWVAADRPPAPLPAATTPAPVTTVQATTTTSPAPSTTTVTKPTPAPAKKPKAAAVPPRPKPSTAAPHHARPKARRKPKKHRRRPAPSGPRPLRATPPLGNGSYVFPVAGQVSWGDSYGGARSDVSDGWHHGDDLFASLGTPVVAVTDGTVFSVGWNRVGGWRLWLIDRSGNEFYYAHLSGYTKLGKNNLRVHRGDVLGFVGNTGDAVTTDAHLHFEVHPNPLLYLGYDGAVDPTTYLRRWRQLGSIKAPPPVPLPGSAPAGWGSATDFRQLLTLRPMPVPKRATAANQTVVANHGWRPEPATREAADQPARPEARPGPGPAPTIIGLLLIAVSALALMHTRRAAAR